MRFHPLAIVLALAAPAWADITLLGIATIPGDATDLSGLTGRLADGTPKDRLGGMGSGIAYTGVDNRYVMIADRGPKDGGPDFQCRFHTFDIAVAINPTPSVKAKLVSTSLLKNKAGKPLVGDPAAFDKAHPFDLEKSRRLDPEAVRVGKRGTIFLADEFGPYLLEFSRAGELLRSLPVPAKFIPRKLDQEATGELPPHNTVGRQPNRGFEGLAIAPDGSKLYALLQNPLIQDGAVNAKLERIGIHNRLLELDVASGKTREFVYSLDGPDLGANELVAVGGTEFLVLERDARVGKNALVKKVFRIDLAGATDVSALAALPAKGLPIGVKAVHKSLFLDLLDVKFTLKGPAIPDKLEGMAFGPDLADGRHLLLITTDNDFVADVPIQIYAFAVGKGDLPAFQRQLIER
jgi:hypothetical protein